MNKNLYPLLENIKGNWFLQENFYLINHKKQEKYKKKVSFLKTFNNNNLFKKKTNNNLNINNYFIENRDYKVFLFKIKQNQKNLVINKTINYSKRLKYHESIYIISNNFMISLVIVTKLESKQYIGLKISSYIRLIQE
nr:hypothetical protein Ycf58 [Echinothamnion sp.]